MNVVIILGRLTRDVESQETKSNLPIAKFTVAVDRSVKSGEEKTTDFIRVVSFGKTAELCTKYLGKGRQVAIQGRIQTGSYKKENGETVYTTEVVADRVQFLGASDKTKSENQENVPNGFEDVSDDGVPF